MNVGDKLYFARIVHETGVYEVCDLTVRTVEDTYFVGNDKKDKRSYLFGYNSLGVEVFKDRKEAVSAVRKAEKNKKYEVY